MLCGCGFCGSSSFLHHHLLLAHSDHRNTSLTDSAVISPMLRIFRRSLQARSFWRSCSSSTKSNVKEFECMVADLDRYKKFGEISDLFDKCPDKNEVIQHSIEKCSSLLEGHELWEAKPDHLPPCTYHSLLSGSVVARDINQLDMLLDYTNDYTRVAGTIGIGGLFNLYKPFLDGTVEAAELDKKIFSRFLGWIANFMHSDLAYFQAKHFFFYYFSLYRNDLDHAMTFIEQFSCHKLSLDSIATKKLSPSLDPSKISAIMVLTCYSFMSARNILRATSYLQKSLESGELNVDELPLRAYSDTTLKAVPVSTFSNVGIAPTRKLKRHRSDDVEDGIDVDTTLARIISDDTSPDRDISSTIDFNSVKINLNNLYNLAKGSSDQDRNLRKVFYTSLLNGNKPRLLLKYEQMRSLQEKKYYLNPSGEISEPPSLNLDGYKCVMKAHMRLLDVKGMLSSLSQWNQTALLVSTSRSSDKSFVPPDGSVYEILISFLESQPQYIKEKYIIQIYELLRHSSVAPETEAIISLFSLAKKARSWQLVDDLLGWVDAIRSPDIKDFSAETSSNFQPSFTARDINSNAKGMRHFSQSDLFKIYHLALDTNSSLLNRGDKCLDILIAMKRDGIKLSGEKVALVMKSLKNSHNYEALLELFNAMNSLGVERDSRHVSFAAIAYVRSGRVARGIDLLDRFEKAGKNLDSSAYIATSFDLLSRLCNNFVPITLEDGRIMGQEEAVPKCLNMMLHVLKREQFYPATMKHLGRSMKLLNDAIYDEMISHLEDISANSETHAQSSRTLLKMLTQLRRSNRS